jgi:hypothetical protein
MTAEESAMSDRHLMRDSLVGVPTVEEFPAIRLSDVEREMARASGAGPSTAGPATAVGPEPEDAPGGGRGADPRSHVAP